MPEQAQGGGGPEEMIRMVGKGLNMLSQVFGQQNPEAGQAFADVEQHYIQVVQQVAGGGQQPQQPQQQPANQAGQGAQQENPNVRV